MWLNVENHRNPKSRDCDPNELDSDPGKSDSDITERVAD